MGRTKDIVIMYVYCLPGVPARSRKCPSGVGNCFLVGIAQGFLTKKVNKSKLIKWSGLQRPGFYIWLASYILGKH